MYMFPNSSIDNVEDDNIIFLDLKPDPGLVPKFCIGYIKEFIDVRPNRLGILFSHDCGLVLFHSRHAWINGTKTSGLRDSFEDLSPGSYASFYHYQIEDASYRDSISPHGTLRQATAIWFGRRPAHLLKETETGPLRREMKAFRDDLAWIYQILKVIDVLFRFTFT